jgi:hypothetical protein
MERIPVSSSTIAAMGYDPTTCTLEVEFNSGTLYQYTGVPQGEFEAFMQAESKGSYLHTNIKKYPCARL